LVARAVLGQQVSTAAARTHAGRLVLAHGEPVADPEGGLTHLFPTPQALSRLDPARLAMPGSRRRTLLGVVGALTDGSLRLDPLAPDGAHSAREQLAALPGIGPWTVQTVLMRAFADPDAFLPTDLGVRLAAERLGLPAKPGALTRHARAWRPYRAYAVQYLWATGRHPVNDHPGAPDAVAPPASTSPRPRPTSSGSG
jgi:AraC family transcriptional regulator of adaptative response / DNA-3-methyladenine glycosylase II